MTQSNIIPVFTGTINEESIQLVNARDLHAFLEVKKHFSDWIKERIDQYGFTQDIDFIVKHFSVIDDTAFGGKRKVIDYHITIDMAKELAMVERNEKGKQARRYFIEMERRALESIGVIKVNTPISKTEEHLWALNVIAEIFNYSESAKVIAFKSALSNTHPELVPALPSYVIDAPKTLIAQGDNSEPVLSLTEILKRSDVGISAVTANKALLALGLLEIKTRPSTSKGVKEYKVITKEGLKYGKNVTSPNQPRETQPLWYESSAAELVEMIKTFLLK